MKVVKYTCDKCETKIQSEEYLAGLTDDCPECGHINNVPKTKKQLKEEKRKETLNCDCISEHSSHHRATIKIRAKDLAIVTIILVLLCPVLLIRGCIVVTHPALSEDDINVIENWERDWWSTVKSRDLAKDIYEETKDPKFKKAAEELDRKQIEQWRREPKGLGTPRVTEALIIFSLAASCIIALIIIANYHPAS